MATSEIVDNKEETVTDELVWGVSGVCVDCTPLFMKSRRAFGTNPSANLMNELSLS